MFKAYAHKFKKPVADENDSIDELETLETQDGTIPRMLPESYAINKNILLHKNSPSRAKRQGRESPSPLQLRNQSQEHKAEDYTSVIKQQSYQLNSSSIVHSPPRAQMTSDLPAVTNEAVNRAREYSFNPKGPDCVDFSHPYNDLVNKIYSDSTQTRKTASSKERYEVGANRLAKHTEEDIQGSSYIPKQGTGCTFAPTGSNSKNPRNLTQFLEDQKQYQNKVEAKKRKLADEQMLREKTSEGTHKPEICQKSVKILEKKKQQQQQEKAPAYQRLYNSSKKPGNTTNNEAPEIANFTANLTGEGEAPVQQGLQRPKSMNKFRPDIQKKSKIIKRDEKVDHLLYNDALRRQNKFNDATKPKSKSNSVAMSSTSKRAIATRFIKEFDIIIEDFLEAEKSQKLNYVQLNELLKRLCFLKCSDQVDHPSFIHERTLIYDSWYILNGDKYKGVHRRNLLVFLLAVLNLHFPITKILKDEKDRSVSPSEYGQDRSHNPLLTEENDPLSKSSDRSFQPILPEGQPAREKRSVGFFDDEGNYEVTEEEVRELHNMFEPWYVNRLCAGDNLGHYLSRRGQEGYTFHPEINQTSKDLAQNYREKLLAGTADLIHQNKVMMPKDGKMTHADLLIASKKVAEEKINKFAELVQEEHNKDHTFKPQISPYTPISQGDGYQQKKSVYARKEKSMTPEPLGKERVNELYALSKLKSEKYDKDTEEIEYERNYEECTFQPNKYLRRDAQPKASNSSGYFAKGIEKSIERIRNARVEREQHLSASKNTRENYEGQFVCSMDKSMRNTSKDRTPKKDNRSKSPISNARETPSQIKESFVNRSYSTANIRKDNYEDQGVSYPTYEGQRQHYEGFNYEIEEDQQAQKNLAFASEIGRSSQEPVREITPFIHKDFEDKIDDNEEDRVPLLFVDVNLGQGKAERITVFEGDTAEGLAQRFSEEYGLEPLMKSKLKEMLDMQIAGLLSRIDEELHSGYSETERQYKHQY